MSVLWFISRHEPNDDQRRVAAAMGFEDGDASRGVEKFRQSYYTHAANLHRLLSEVTRRLLKPPDSLPYVRCPGKSA